MQMMAGEVVMDAEPLRIFQIVHLVAAEMRVGRKKRRPEE
jgi:hypothetical protein